MSMALHIQIARLFVVLTCVLTACAAPTPRAEAPPRPATISSDLSDLVARFNAARHCTRLLLLDSPS